MGAVGDPGSDPGGSHVPTSTQEAHRQVCVRPAIEVEKVGLCLSPRAGPRPQILTRRLWSMGNADCIRTGRGGTRWEFHHT